MRFYKLTFIFLLYLIPFSSQAQNVSLLGKTDEFIMESVTGYASVHERALEHEQYPILAFEDKDRELSFYFTFYQGQKVCDLIRSVNPVSNEPADVKLVKTTYNKGEGNIWENPEKTVQARITVTDNEVILTLRNLR
jgi:hypothetical protein